MKTELITHSGSDLLVVNAARVSFDKESEWDCETDNTKLYWEKLSQQDTKLINYLAKHNHFTPFTHCVITLRETVPIFVARQRFKHTVGFSYNEVSRRYVDGPPEFYTPDVWRSRPEDKKQGSGGKEITEIDLGLGSVLISNQYKMHLQASLGLYNDLIRSGVCPEQARMVLPQSMYTSYYTTGSLYAFARAYKLRSQPDAQVEIQELAKQWDDIVRPLFPVSWEVLVDV